MDYRRTHRCNELTIEDVDKEVSLSGWVHRRRDHGGLIFIDLRDRFGLTQLVFDPSVDSNTHHLASQLRSEWVVTVKGKVRARGAGLINPKLDTGAIEVEGRALKILSKAKTPPFAIGEESTTVNEELRLKYRYLDMRRGEILHNLVVRHQAMQLTRLFFHNEGFIEVSTPILGRSTPEGARDYLVPSRIHPGSFYALPQSPQLFKQLLMIGGMDRYFQLASCFRDEDLRADRQPEFMQIDVEMSFAYPEDLQKIIYRYLKLVFKQCSDYDIPETLPTMSYQDCMEHYGTDRPDLRFGMPLVRVDPIARSSTLAIFHTALDQGGCVKGLCVKGGNTLSRKEIERYAEFVKPFGLDGLGWMKKEKEGLSSHLVKFFSTEQQHLLDKALQGEEGDLFLFGAGKETVVNQSLDHLRRLIAKERGLIAPHTYAFLWVTHFPCFEWDAEERRYQSVHHPFTMPHPDDLPHLDTAPLKVRSHAYDIVINGYEIGGGSQRNHDYEVQQRIFHTLGLSPQEIEEKFGFFIEALQYGTPPHLGIALGLDRIVMLLTRTDNIKEVNAFPKTQKASDLMMHCPAHVHSKQLHELHIQTVSKETPWR